MFKDLWVGIQRQDDGRPGRQPERIFAGIVFDQQSHEALDGSVDSAVDDDRAALIAHEIAATVEKEMDYPGRIKITVIRESRSTSYAS